MLGVGLRAAASARAREGVRCRTRKIVQEDIPAQITREAVELGQFKVLRLERLALYNSSVDCSQK